MLVRFTHSVLTLLISIFRNETYIMLFKSKFFSRKPLAIAILEMTMTISCTSYIFTSAGCSYMRLGRSMALYPRISTEKCPKQNSVVKFCKKRAISLSSHISFDNMASKAMTRRLF